MAQETEYRRGVILGLTLAEVFILIVFLLLLMLMLLDEHWRGKDREWRTERAALKSDIYQIEESLPFEWPEDLDEPKNREEIVTMMRQLKDAEAIIEKAERLVAMEDQLETWNDVLKDFESPEEVNDLLNDLQTRTEELKSQEVQATGYKEQLRILMTKGINPPCWYQIVHDPESGGTREKPYYTLSVGVFDKYMVLRPVPAPQGGAIDDGGVSYRTEAELLRIDKLPYGTELSDSEFETHLAPFFEAGRSKRIRTYPCIFWVKVWDNTSIDAKKRWQRAHDGVIEGMFGAYTVQNEPWL